LPEMKVEMKKKEERKNLSQSIGQPDKTKWVNREGGGEGKMRTPGWQAATGPPKSRTGCGGGKVGGDSSFFYDTPHQKSKKKAREK